MVGKSKAINARHSIAREGSVISLSTLVLARVMSAILFLGMNSEAGVQRPVEGLDVAHARQSLTKSGFGVKSLLGTQNDNGVGVAIGAHLGRFLTESIYLGGGGYAGELTGAPTGLGFFAYGGAIVGGEWKVSERWMLSASMLFGGGTGKFAGGTPTGDSGLAFEPQVSLATQLGKGTRLGFSAGYLYFPRMAVISGMTVGVTLEFRSLTLSFPE